METLVNYIFCTFLSTLTDLPSHKLCYNSLLAIQIDVWFDVVYNVPDWLLIGA